MTRPATRFPRRRLSARARRSWPPAAARSPPPGARDRSPSRWSSRSPGRSACPPRAVTPGLKLVPVGTGRRRLTGRKGDAEGMPAPRPLACPCPSGSTSCPTRRVTSSPGARLAPVRLEAYVRAPVDGLAERPAPSAFWDRVRHRVSEPPAPATGRCCSGPRDRPRLHGAPRAGRVSSAQEQRQPLVRRRAAHTHELQNYLRRRTRRALACERTSATWALLTATPAAGSTSDSWRSRPSAVVEILCLRASDMDDIARNAEGPDSWLSFISGRRAPTDERPRGRPSQRRECPTAPGALPFGRTYRRLHSRAATRVAHPSAGARRPREEVGRRRPRIGRPRSWAWTAFPYRANVVQIQRPEAENLDHGSNAPGEQRQEDRCGTACGWSCREQSPGS